MAAALRRKVRRLVGGIERNVGVWGGGRNGKIAGMAGRRLIWGVDWAAYEGNLAKDLRTTQDGADPMGAVHLRSDADAGPWAATENVDSRDFRLD